jgi:hypothetical protein
MLPFVDPVRVLQRFVAVGAVAQRLVYWDDVSDGGGPRGFLTIQLPPPSAMPPPATQPASQPTTMPTTAEAPPTSQP